MRRLSTTLMLMSCTVSVAAAELDPSSVHARFTEAFNNREWATVKDMLSDDVVFHRANAPEVHVGPDSVMDIFQATIGAPEQWNVKFAILDSTDQFAGKDGRVVERGDFAVTAGPEDASCYRGSYLMTWVPQADDTWKLQMLTWQDVETDRENCNP